MARQDSIARLVRPKDAAISCSHFWGYALLLAGIGGLIVGGILFIGESPASVMWCLFVVRCSSEAICLFDRPAAIRSPTAACTQSPSIAFQERMYRAMQGFQLGSTTPSNVASSLVIRAKELGILHLIASFDAVALFRPRPICRNDSLFRRLTSLCRRRRQSGKGWGRFGWGSWP